VAAIAAGLACAAMAAVSVMGAATADATFPGANGKLTFTRTAGGLSDIWLMDPDGQNQSLLAGDPATNQTASSFSADGERIVFATELQGGKTGIVVIGVDGSNPTLVTDDGGSFASPHFSPSGQQIVYQVGPSGNEDIAIIDVDGRNRQLLTSGPARDFGPSFSPDGQRIVFERSDGTGINVWTMAPDGQNPVPLTGGSTDDFGASFAPDGNRIVFVQAPPGDQPGEVVVMDANGQNQQPLTNTPGVFEQGPVFSPDGQKIAFARFPTGGGSDGEIVVMDADGQNQAPITQNTDFDNQVDWQPLNPPGCSLMGESKSRNLNEVVVTLLCSENVAATATGELTAKVPKPRWAEASKKKVVPLTPANAAVPQGAATVLTLPIPKKGRKALKKSGKAGNAALTVAVTDDLGESAILTHALKLKKKKKKKNKK
jgi:Tol biopolymer transport system component